MIVGPARLVERAPRGQHRGLGVGDARVRRHAQLAFEVRVNVRERAPVARLGQPAVDEQPGLE
jgi:hypothetical protein